MFNGASIVIDGTRGRSRTDTPQRAADFKSAMTTNSITRAYYMVAKEGIAPPTAGL